MNGKWNLIAKLGSKRDAPTLGLTPLQRDPVRMLQIGLRWQPKCSKGVRMFNVDLSGKTPAGGIPVGVDAHLKYQSKKSFGAVLIARNPVEVTAYNDEALFKEWIENNKAQLYNSFGHQLKKYGFWIITTTYTAPGCSINAWMDKDKDAVLSAKAKAAMVGDFGAELDWTDKITDKDWCHYTAKPTSGMFDSRPVAPRSKAEAIRSSSRKSKSKSRSPHSVAVVNQPQNSPNFASQQGISYPATQEPDGVPTRTLSRKRAFSPNNNHIRISKLDTETDYDVDPKGFSAQQIPVSPLSSATEKMDDTAYPEITFTQLTEQNPPVDPAVGEGVVMFYDGLYTNPLEWWLEGAKSVTTSLFGSARPGDRVDNEHVEHGTILRDGSAQYDNREKLQSTQENDQHCSPCRNKPSQRTLDDFDEDYRPDKDEGVHPRYWPAKDPSLRSTTKAANRTSLFSEGSRRSTLSPDNSPTPLRRVMSLTSRIANLFTTSPAEPAQHFAPANDDVATGPFRVGGYGEGQVTQYGKHRRQHMDETMEEEEEARPPYLHSMIAGGLGGTTGDLLMHSIDTVKTRQQGDPHIPPKYNSLSSAYSKILRQEGVRRGLYSGVTPAFLGSFPGTIIFFGVYEYSKRHMIDAGVNHSLAYLAGGFIADLAASVVYVPSEVLKTRLQLQGRYNNPFFKSGYNYRSTLDAARTIMRQEGVSALFHGYRATIWRDLPFSALQFAFYEQERKLAMRWAGSKEIGIPMEIATAATAGGMAGVITCPLDVVKTRIQTQISPSQEAPVTAATKKPNLQQQPERRVPAASSALAADAALAPQQKRLISTSSPNTTVPKPGSVQLDTSSMVHGLRIIYKTEGLAGCFRGVGPRFVWTSVQSSTMLVLYQVLLKQLDTYQLFVSDRDRVA